MGRSTPAACSPCEHARGPPDLLAALHHRQVEDVETGPDDNLEVILKQAARQTVRTDDHQLPVIRWPAPQEGADRSPRFGLAILGDRVLEVERERICGGRGRLREEFRTGAGHE